MAMGRIWESVVRVDVAKAALDVGLVPSGPQVLELDGISFEFEDWWFNVRLSNTEPLIRLNLEAKTADGMTRHRDEVLAIIRF